MPPSHISRLLIAETEEVMASRAIVRERSRGESQILPINENQKTRNAANHKFVEAFRATNWTRFIVRYVQDGSLAAFAPAPSLQTVRNKFHQHGRQGGHRSIWQAAQQLLCRSWAGPHAGARRRMLPKRARCRGCNTFRYMLGAMSWFTRQRMPRFDPRRGCRALE